MKRGTTMIKVENYPNAYKEVYVILENMNENDVKKIPESFLNIIKTEMNKQYEFKIDKNKDFKNQKILRETKVILSYISFNYWMTEEQKSKIKEIFIQDYIDEENKKDKYIPEELFKNKRVKVEKENTEKNKNEIIKDEKIGLFQKILRKLKIFLSKSSKKG